MFFSQNSWFFSNSFHINKKKRNIYTYIYKIYNQQIDDHISKGYIEKNRRGKKTKEKKNCSAHCMTTYLQ
jgi:hypothetical protein